MSTKTFTKTAQPEWLLAMWKEIDDKTFDNLPRLDAWGALELDIKTVRLGIIVQFHRASSLKLRSKNALWIVSPSASVTTRRNRGRSSPGTTIRSAFLPLVLAAVLPLSARAEGLRVLATDARNAHVLLAAHFVHRRFHL